MRRLKSWAWTRRQQAALGVGTLLGGVILCGTTGAADGAPGTDGRFEIPPASAVAPERLERLSRAYLGVPYRLDCLGESAGSDPDPLFRRDAADCQTLVEQVMAEAIADWVGGLEAAVRLTRYRNSQVRLESRYHYCVPDWLQNCWPVRDVTASLHAPTVATRRRIDLPRFLASRGGDPTQAPRPAQQLRTQYLSLAVARQWANRMPHGVIGVFVLQREDIVAGHLGFLFRRDHRVYLRHASQTHRKVIEEPLLTYLARVPKRFVGMKILQPDVEGLRRSGE